MPLRNPMPGDIAFEWVLTGVRRHRKAGLLRNRIVVVVEETREHYREDRGRLELVSRERRWRDARSFDDLKLEIEP